MLKTLHKSFKKNYTQNTMKTIVVIKIKPNKIIANFTDIKTSCYICCQSACYNHWMLVQALAHKPALNHDIYTKGFVL